MREFTLIGHDCPSGEYPSVVLPVGHSASGELTVLYQGGPPDQQADVVPEDSEYVIHDAQLTKDLEFFEPARHRLFAYGETDVRFYEEAQEAEFFAAFLKDPTNAEVDPFVRLSFAKRTQAPYLVLVEIAACLVVLKETKAFCKSWAEREMRDIMGSIGFDVPAFPAQPIGPFPGSHDLAAPEPSVETKKLLLIEDEEGIAQFIQDRYSERGYQVDVAKDGAEGLDKAIHLKPNIIFLDLALPFMSGEEVLRHLSRLDETRDIPIIIISAHQDRWDQQAEEFGNVYTVRGPVETLEDLQDQLRSSDSRRLTVPISTIKRIFLSKPLPFEFEVMDELVEEMTV